MSAVPVLYALLFYVSTAILGIGLAGEIFIFARHPPPLKIPTTPAPTTHPGPWTRHTRRDTVRERRSR